MLAARTLTLRTATAGRPLAGRRVGQSLVRRVPDHSTTATHMMHKAYYGMFVAMPLAFILAPSPIAKPVDLILGVAFPIHAHVGMNAVISDYVPPAMRTNARYALLAVTVATTLGLLRWNIAGDGMTASVKELWKKPESKE